MPGSKVENVTKTFYTDLGAHWLENLDITVYIADLFQLRGHRANSQTFTGNFLHVDGIRAWKTDVERRLKVRSALLKIDKQQCSKCLLDED